MNAVSNYIHYHEETVTPHEYILENFNVAKQNMLNNFVNTAFQELKELNPNMNLDISDAYVFLESLSGKNGVVGSTLLKNLQESSWLFNQDGTSKIQTSAGLINESEGDDDLHIPQYAVNLLDEVNSRINNIIDVMSHCGENIIVAQLQAVRDGKTIPEIEKLNNKQFSAAEISSAQNRMLRSMETLQENISALSSLSDNGGSSEIKYSSLLQSIRGCFNDIGGHLFEVACAYVAKHSKYYFNKNIVPEINMAFTRSGAKVFSNVANTGLNRINGHEVKNDIEMYYNENGISFIIGGNIKLNNQVRQHFGSNITIRNVHKGMTFGQFVEYGLQSGANQANLQWIEGHIGALKTKKGGKDVPYVLSKSLESNFDNFKQYCQYETALHMLTGSGDFKNHDFSTMFVVNNKVLSMYDLLRLIANDFNEYANFKNLPTMIGYKSQVARTVKSVAERGPQHKDWRSHETINILNNMYKRKINMDLYFSRALMSV